MDTKESDASVTEKVIWACVEEGFYVATCENSFLGFVDRVESEVFQVCNAQAQQVGLLNNLETAQECLLQHARDDGLLPQNGYTQR